MLPSTTVAIRGLGLWYNKSNIRYTFCSKRFRVFLEGQGYKDKPTSLLPIKTYSFDVGAYHPFYTCMCSIYSLQV